MYAIVIYDASTERVHAYLKLLRQYLFHIQNSAFEGEISQKNMKILKKELFQLNKSKKDSVIIYTFHNSKYVKRNVLGPEKGLETNIL